MRIARSPFAVACCLLGVLMGCQGQDADTSKPDDQLYQLDRDVVLVQEGQDAYRQFCIGCHGELGDGQGEGSAFLHPKPRDFTQAYFRFGSARSGQLPTDADLSRTIREGLRGSAMPGFPLLTDRRIEALVAYIKTLSPKWQERGPGRSIPFVNDPYREDPDKSAAIARGEAVYHGFANCWNCHPAYVGEPRINEYIVMFDGEARESFREDLGNSVGKDAIDGELKWPTDFLRDFTRSGTDVEDLYRSIGAGITGTAMPTWIDSMDIPGAHEGDPPLTQQADVWAMAYYVQSLIARRPAMLREGQFAVRERPRPTGPKITAGEEEVGEAEILDEEEFLDEDF